jgi:hypothetical protein
MLAARPKVKTNLPSNARFQTRFHQIRQVRLSGKVGGLPH